MSRPASKAGSAFTENLIPQESASLATDRILLALDGLRKAQDEDRTGTKGTLTSIKEGEKLNVFLARGCGQLTVEVCEGVYGKELFHSLKMVGHHAKHELLLLKWPVLITNRLALAVSGHWWGGDETFTLLASDCQTARADQIELWSPPTEHKIEGRSKPPASFLTWLRYAENHTQVFGAVYGIEHMSERLAFLKALQEAHEEDEHAYPTAYCIKLFEELNAVWVEQVREARRTLCAKLGTENPRMDLKLIVLAPGPDGFPNFRFSRVWDLKNPGTFNRSWSRGRKGPLTGCSTVSCMTPPLRRRGKATAKPQELKGETPPEIDPKTGAAPRLALTDTPTGPDPPRPNPKGDGKGEKAGGAAAKAYPADTQLTLTAIKRSIAQVSEDPKSKTPICWDAHWVPSAILSSQPRASPPYAEARLLCRNAGLELRRGGLKNGPKISPKINPKDVDGGIAQLQAQHKAKITDKAAEGKAKAKAKAKSKAGWLVPDDYSGPVTSMEQDLGKLVLGPDFGWHDAFRAAQFVDTRPLVSDEPSRRTACYEALKNGGELDAVSDKSSYLRSHVASHLVNARLSGDMSLSVEDILRNAVDHGHPQLAEEAHSAMTSHSSLNDKAGRQEPEHEAKLSNTTWASDGLGHGELQFLAPLFSTLGSVPFFGYRDQLELPDTDWFHEPIAIETRQCLALHAGAALAGPDESRGAAAVRLRLEMLKEAVNAFGHLGDAPPYVSEAEAFIRHNAHDAYISTS